MTRLYALIDKEWSDSLKNRYVLMMMVLMPVLFVLIPAGTLFAMRVVPAEDLEGEISEFPPGWQNPEWRDFSAPELIQVAIASQFTIFFLIVPLAIPMTIATYSVIGEKRERSLEPLLATPITTFELLAAKSIAAAAPGVALTWLSAGLFTLVARVLAVSDRAFAAIISPTWLLTILLLAPLLTVLATTVGLMVSSRVNDPRVAEQLGMIVIVPVLALFFGQMSGVIQLNVAITLLVAFALVVIDLALLAVGVGLFQREAILTRWR
jgi:ABC-2 type transport system permease protein